MKKGYYYFSIMFALVLTGCLSNNVTTLPTQTHLPTATIGATKTPTATPTATTIQETTQNEGQKILEVDVEKVDDAGKFVAGSIWSLNQESLQEVTGATTEEEFIDYLKTHNWTIPATENTDLTWFSSGQAWGDLSFRRGKLNLDTPLRLLPQIRFISPEQSVSENLKDQIYPSLDFSSPEEVQLSSSISFNISEGLLVYNELRSYLHGKMRN